MTGIGRTGGTGFRVSRLRRRLAQGVDRAFLADDGRELPALVVAGAPRSGTTWLAEVLARATGSRLLFEPLAPWAIPSNLAVPAFPYLQADDESPALEAYVRRVLTGGVRGGWIDKQPVTRRPLGRLAKFVRVSFMLGWLHRRFPHLVLVFVTRDPWSVVRSRVDMGWDPAPDLGALLAQAPLLEALGPLADEVRLVRTRLGGGAEAEVEANAVLWAVANRVAHAGLNVLPAIRVSYEVLRDDPPGELGRLIDEVARRGGFDTRGAARALAAETRPSMTSRGTARAHGREPFERRFGAEAASSVGDVAARFGLGWARGHGWELRP